MMVSADAARLRLTLATVAADQGREPGRRSKCLALKANQDSLLSDARSGFGKVSSDHPTTPQEEAGHGRRKTRTSMVVSASGLAEHDDFPGLKAFGRIGSRRETGGTIQTETRHFALSWMPAPEVFRTTVRAHWEIENALHWQLDV